MKWKYVVGSSSSLNWHESTVSFFVRKEFENYTVVSIASLRFWSTELQNRKQNYPLHRILYNCSTQCTKYDLMELCVCLCYTAKLSSKDNFRTFSRHHSWR